MMATTNTGVSSAMTTRDLGKHLRLGAWLGAAVILSLVVGLLSSNNDDARENLLSQAQAVPNKTLVSKMTLARILNYSATVGSITYVPPCGVAEGVLESTSTLLTATAVSKADNSTLQHWDLWTFYDALFTTIPDSTSGFIPKYLYPIKNTSHPLPLSPYIGETRIPNWPMFSNMSNPTKQPPNCSPDNGPCWVGSGRISAIPFHATFLLELVSHLEQQEYLHESDVLQLQSYWDRIYKYHQYLHEVVMRGCDFSDSNSSFDKSPTPCYNIVHPWESLIDPTSPTWDMALQPTMDHIQAINWSLPWPLPKQVEDSYQYQSGTYEAMIYLTQCLANQTTRDDDNYPYQYHQDAKLMEDRILQECPFAMLDVGYASALAQADADLLHVSFWLSAQQDLMTSRNLSVVSRNSKLTNMVKWKQQSEHVLDSLWDPRDQSYLSQYAVPSTTDSLPTMHFCRLPVANNFMIFWIQWNRPQDDHPGPEPHLQEMALQLLRHSGKYSFDCGSFPLWSRGCSSSAEKSTPPLVDPRLNYFVGAGLTRNQESVTAFGNYLTNSSLEMICETSANGGTGDQCAANATWFQEVYRAAPGSSNFHLDECGTSSTATAAILFHLLVSDYDFSYDTPIPPIRNSWVITLITAELMIAFSVGVSCVYLSLNLVRSENSRDDEEDPSLTENRWYTPMQSSIESDEENFSQSNPEPASTDAAGSVPIEE
jgi:hypothetical protein